MDDLAAADCREGTLLNPALKKPCVENVVFCDCRFVDRVRRAVRCIALRCTDRQEMMYGVPREGEGGEGRGTERLGRVAAVRKRRGVKT